MSVDHILETCHSAIEYQKTKMLESAKNKNCVENLQRNQGYTGIYENNRSGAVHNLFKKAQLTRQKFAKENIYWNAPVPFCLRPEAEKNGI